LLPISQTLFLVRRAAGVSYFPGVPRPDALGEIAARLDLARSKAAKRILIGVIGLKLFSGSTG
jgi:hypothetical protein